MSPSIIEKVVDQSGLFAVLVLGMYLMSRVGWWVARRLLDPPADGKAGGVLVEWLTAHKEFLAGLEKRDKAQAETARRHEALLEQLHAQCGMRGTETAAIVEGLETLAGWAVDPDAPHATVRFNHSMIDFAKAKLLELSLRPGTPPAEAKEIEAQIEKLLLAVQHRHRGVLEKLEVVP